MATNSAVQKVLAALEHDSGFQLVNDLPLFKAALAEIDSRLSALEARPAIAIAPPDVGSPVPPGTEA